MNRIQFSELMPSWLFEYCSTVPKMINNLLLVMGVFNIFLLFSVLQATILPDLGISPTFIAFLLCAQNALTWFALNNHRLSSLPTIVANDFVVGCLLGISVGGSIVAFILSQFFGQISNCVSINMTNFEYVCKHTGIMKDIWFWSGLVFWMNFIISMLIIYAKDELSYVQTQNYEHIGLALEELQSSFERTAVYSPQAPGDGAFFGGNNTMEPLGEAQFPTTPSQEETKANGRRLGGYGAESGFDDGIVKQSASEQNKEATQIFV